MFIHLQYTLLTFYFFWFMDCIIALAIGRPWEGIIEWEGRQGRNNTELCIKQI